MGVALQVFYNLGYLESTLVTIVTSYREAVQHEIQNAVNPSSLLQSVNSELVIHTNKHVYNKSSDANSVGKLAANTRKHL